MPENDSFNKTVLFAPILSPCLEVRMKSMLLALTGVLALSASAFGQTVSTEKQAESTSVFKNVYSTVDLRQYFDQTYQGDERTGGRQFLHSRFYLGTTAFDEKLDVYALFRIERRAHDTHVRNLGPVVVGTYTTLSGKFGDLSLYSENYVKGHEQTYTASYTGPQYRAPVFETETVLGKFTLGGDVTTVARIDGSSQKVEIIERDRSAFAAVNNDETSTKQEDMSYGVWVTAQAGLQIAGVKGLKLSYMPEYYRNYDPTYKFDAAANDLATFDGYDVTQTSYHYVELGYALTDSVRVSNTFVAVAEGFAEAPKDGLRYRDYVKVSYKVK